jgi:prophage DNA circulation protein
MDRHIEDRPAPGDARDEGGRSQTAQDNRGPEAEPETTDSLTTILHDQQDAVEAIQEQWRDAVRDVREGVAVIAGAALDWRQVFAEINVLAAGPLSEATTEATRVGAEFGARKAQL